MYIFSASWHTRAAYRFDVERSVSERHAAATTGKCSDCGLLLFIVSVWHFLRDCSIPVKRNLIRARKPRDNKSVSRDLLPARVSAFRSIVVSQNFSNRFQIVATISNKLEVWSCAFASLCVARLFLLSLILPHLTVYKLLSLTKHVPACDSGISLNLCERCAANKMRCL